MEILPLLHFSQCKENRGICYIMSDKHPHTDQLYVRLDLWEEIDKLDVHR